MPFFFVSQLTAICGALTCVSGTVLGAEDATGEDSISPRGACTPGGKADSKYTSKLIKVISGADEEVKQGSVGLSKGGVRVMF